jgi:beta-glucanase (GH16 family)
MAAIGRVGALACRKRGGDGMSRRWRLLLGMAVSVTVLLWGLGVFGDHTRSSGVSAALAPSASVTPTATPSASTDDPGQPASTPEFSATFSGSQLDTSVWATCYPNANPSTGCTNFGNTEYEWYMPSQDQLAGGNLQLVATRAPTAGTTKAGSYEQYNCRSGIVTSDPSFRFKFGYVQVVADVADTPGLWSGLWLAAANNQWPPEIDLVEAWGHEGGPANADGGVFFHPTPAGTRQVQSPLTASQVVGWHTYSLKWTRSSITWYIDGKMIMNVTDKTNQIPRQEMFFIADLAEYARPIGSRCDGSMLIRSVKVWKL